MSGTIRVFVNGQGLDLPAGASAADAVSAVDPALAERVRAGTANVTDGRGIAVPPEQPLSAGAILRAAVSARRPPAEGSDAGA